MTEANNDAKTDQADLSDVPESADPAEETRRKFREALDRKHQRQHAHATAEAAEHDGSDKAHGAQAPTKSPQFRRKAI